jgi:hypothetical protein
LHDAAAVAEIDEDKPAVIAPALRPAEQNQLAAHGVDARLAAIIAPLPVAQMIGKNPFHNQEASIQSAKCKLKNAKFSETEFEDKIPATDPF